MVTWSSPRTATAASSCRRAASRSAAQTLRPSMTPSERRVAPPRSRSSAGPSCSGARTRSRWTSATGRVRTSIEGASAQPGEVGREADLEAGALGQRPPGGEDRVELGVAPIEGEAGLVDLHLAGPGGDERAQQLGVDRHQRVEGVERPRQPLGQQQEGRRAHHDRARLHPEGPGLLELLDPVRRPCPEALAGGELGDQVVVVRVEPLGHLQRPRAGRAAGAREVGVEALRVPARPGARGSPPPPRRRRGRGRRG